MKTTWKWSHALVVLAVFSPGSIGVAQELTPTIPTEAWPPAATALSVTPLPPAEEATSMESIAELSVPNEGVRLDEAITPIASYFQVGGTGTPGGGKPKYPVINVSGAAQIDGIWFAQDAANAAVVGDAEDVAGFRRARLGANGNLADNVAYRMEYDFAASGRPNFTDVWVDVADLPTVGHMKIGQWKQPFSMEPATSFRELMFMERSLAFALVPFRQIGAGFYDTLLDESATYAVSGYRFQTDPFGNMAGDEGYGMSTRETMLLWSNDAGDTLHLGGNYTFNEAGTDTIRIRSTPEVGFTQGDFNNTTNFPIPFFVDTGVLPIANYQVVGAEVAGGVGSWLYQSEIMCALVNQQGAPFLQLPAGYAQLGYVLTGERRPYNPKAAAYTRVIPDVPFGKGGPGAIEVASRYSILDLNDANIAGGRLQDLTFGVNWYLNRFTRIEFNYIHPILDRPIGNETHADVFGTRAQFDF
jgi:phosphate-selective porin OprO and OprP